MKFRNAETVAALLILNMKNYAEEKNKTITRTAVSGVIIADLFGYRNSFIEPSVLKELEFHLRQRGYVIFPVGCSQYALLRISQTRNWIRLSARRVESSLELTIEELDAMIGAEPEDDPESEGE